MVNAGSSSLKLRLIGPDDDVLGARDLPPQPEALAAELPALGAPDAVGHRIVHGGERQSGMLALAGTADMREVLAGVERGDSDACLALDV